MRLLPSEQAVKIQEAISRFDTEGSLTIYEPCNCGSHVRHNNGGNYHQIIYLQKDSGQTFVKWADTCELKPEAEWEVCDSPHQVITSNADWL